MNDCQGLGVGVNGSRCDYKKDPMLMKLFSILTVVVDT